MILDLPLTEKSFRWWQEQGFSDFHEQQKADYLCCACPGAGKTIFALELARRLLLSGRVRRLVIVVPSSHLKLQWAIEAAKFGIQLDEEFSNRYAAPETGDFHGVCVTYAQVAMQPLLHQALCKTSTLAIFDEVHHAGRERSWGDGLYEAFRFAEVRLSLSGTPFRDPGTPIPFVQFDPITGRCKTDINYGYGRALEDEVVRHIVFPTYEGNMSWWSGDIPGEQGKEFNATFADEIPTVEEARRLHTALDPDGDWIREVIRQADDQLIDIRRKVYPAAAGLIVARDQNHADKLAIVVKKLTNSTPVVVISDDKEAGRKIEDFGRSGETSPRWLIAVRMVSEGVDIPRLFVCVFATNIMTELFFIQVMGRVIRLIPGIEAQTAYFYIPRIDRLIGYVESIKRLRDDPPVDVIEFVEDEDVPGDSDPRTIPSRINNWTPYGSTAFEDDVYIGDERFTPREWGFARGIAQSMGINVATELVALAFRRAAEQGLVVSVAPQPESQPDRTENIQIRNTQIRKKLRTKVSHKVNVLVEARKSAGIEIDHESIHRELNRTLGVKQASATIEQLQERLALVSRWIDEVRHVSA